MRQNGLRICLTFLVSSNLLFAAVIVGCQTRTQPPAVRATPNAREQVYADANKAILTDFGATVKRLGERPPPSFPPNATKQQKRAIWADALTDLTVVATKALVALDKLDPPPNMREIHSTTRDFVATYRKGNEAYVAAIRKGDRAQMKAIRVQTESDTATAFGKLRVALQQALLREGKTQQEAEAMTADLVL